MKAFPWLFALAWAIPFWVLYQFADTFAAFYGEMGKELPAASRVIIFQKYILLLIPLPPFAAAFLMSVQKEVTNRQNWIFAGSVSLYGSLTFSPCLIAPFLPLFHLMGAASN